ncbi:MAG: restriction endonuclease subunit R, partial [Negativicutes bacterium]|nr:restriction endonuclease subunit R [Negativicutes bacterium]
STVGKTIVFAKNHLHAEKILAVWNQEYPEYPAHYCRVIDNYTNYAQSLLDEFSDRNKLPQIAISVDMLDTGIDVPEILNLVFFKKVMSKAKFWQMIGRGTRLCEGLLDGEDKQEFYIFDFCSNFEFFRVNGKGKDAAAGVSVQQKLFDLKAEIVYKLQDLAYQTEELVAFRQGLVKELVDRVCALNRDNFAVKQHLRYVDLFGSKKTYEALTYENVLQIASEISPLILPEEDEYTAVRFDALMYQIELAYLVGKKGGKPKGDLRRKVAALTHYGTIPAVTAQKDFLHTLLHTDYIDRGGINEFENIRTKLRELMKYIEFEPQAKYETDFADTETGVEENPSDMGQDYLVNYKKKVNYYIREHENNPAIAKLKTNKPLTKDDVAELEKILWGELGTKEDYLKEFGDTPLGELVRSIVGLDMTAAKEAFSQFIDEANLDPRQIYFVNQIINYIVKNGMMKDLRVLQGSPFTDKGSVVEVFDDMNLWLGIRQAIDTINKNAAA